MSFVKPAQVTKLLASKGIPQGKKTKNAKLPIGGFATFQDEDGWVMVAYNNFDQAEADATPLEQHNYQMRRLIHFILCDMNEYEFKYHDYDISGHFKRYEYFYRKATN